MAGRNMEVMSEELGHGCVEVREVVGNGVVLVRRGPSGCEMAGEAVGDGCEVDVATKRATHGMPRKQVGKIEGRTVGDVVLDTGCAQTMVHCDLVPDHKRVEGETIRLRCTHGDVVTYPLTDLELEVGGVTMKVTAAVVDKLPVSVLLGTDVPQLEILLAGELTQEPERQTEEVMVPPGLTPGPWLKQQ